MGKPEKTKAASPKAGDRVVTVRVPASLADKVDQISGQIDRPRGWIIRNALAAWIDWEEEKHRRILEGLADVDAGRTIPHEDVVAWVKSKRAGNALPRPTPKARK